MHVGAYLARLLDRIAIYCGYPDPKLTAYPRNPNKTLWWWFKTLVTGKPHLRIHAGEYMDRRYLIPRNRWVNVYLHRYYGPDLDPDLHDHPWDNITLVGKGRIVEKVLAANWENAVRHDRVFHQPVQLIAREAGAVVFRRGHQPHQIHAVTPGTLTLFITLPQWRGWGFHRRDGWEAFVPTDPDDPANANAPKSAS